MLISTCRIELIEGKSSKCGCPGRVTYVVRSSRMCQLAKIDKNCVSVDSPLPTSQSLALLTLSSSEEKT